MSLRWLTLLFKTTVWKRWLYSGGRQPQSRLHPFLQILRDRPFGMAVLNQVLPSAVWLGISHRKPRACKSLWTSRKNIPAISRFDSCSRGEAISIFPMSVIGLPWSPAGLINFLLGSGPKRSPRSKAFASLSKPIRKANGRVLALRKSMAISLGQTLISPGRRRLTRGLYLFA